MARYVKEYRQKDAPQVSFQLIHNCLTSLGFKYKTYKGENVFQKGDGWLMAPSFVKITYGTDTVRFEAWIAGAILPGVFMGEYGYTGFVGCAAKGTIKDAGQDVDRILGGAAYALTVGQDIKPGQPLTPVSYQMPVQPVMPQPQYQPVTPVQPQMPVQTAAPVQDAAAGMQFCTQCGNLVNPGTNFCPKCGNRMN